MKAYDSYSIKNKMLERLNSNKDWKAVSGNAVIGAILDEVAEQTAEQARYSEMLFSESKWDVSQDFKQVSALSNIIGYKAKRKVSAKGTIYISDNNKIHTVGRSISVADFTSGNLPGWDQATSKINLTKNATVTDSAGNSYALTSVNPLSAGSYYTSNTIIEGTRKAIRIPANLVKEMAQKSKLNPYVYIPIKIPNLEDAGTAQSSPFLKVLVDTNEYRIVNSLILSEMGDRDVQLIPDLYNKEIFYLKFNTDATRGAVLNLTAGSNGFEYIEVQYLESKGSEGNIYEAFQRFTINTTEGYTLYGISIDTILGGLAEETIAEIKENAPTHYLTTYTTATKSAYQEAIKKIDFGSQMFAQNVKVYAGLDDNGNKVVFASLISPDLESAIEEGEVTENKINSILNLTLDSFKAPTDNLKYKSPNYERLAVGIKCTVPQGSVENTTILSQTIQDTLDDLYGSNSTLDFGKDIYNADIIDSVKGVEDSILSVNTELEANERLEWINAERKAPKSIEEGSVKTIRIPFDFSKILEGTRYTFKNFTNGADYGLRLDFFFKGSSSNLTPYHSTLILKEPRDGNGQSLRVNEPYVLIKDPDTIWHDIGGDLAIPADEYPFVDTSTNLPYTTIDDIDESNLEQYALIEKVLTDDDYNAIVEDTSITQLTLNDSGFISALMVYFIGDNEDTGRIGTGWIEFGITSIYQVLQKYALSDVILRNLLDDFPLSNLKCDVDDTLTEDFITQVLTPYVEIYASLRLYEKDLLINAQSDDPSAVVYIETSDLSSQTTNLGEVKKNRFLSVRCDTV